MMGAMVSLILRRRGATLALAAALASFACRAEAPSRAESLPPARATLAYPRPERGNVVDVYHGVSVPDPYRWLEDPDTPAARAWIEAENRLTSAYLAEIPSRDAIRRRVEELWDYERFGLPYREGGRIFLTRNDGLQNQSVLYVLDDPGAEARELLDPNALSSDGTVALAGTATSEDGHWLAYGLAEAGSDWNTWRVRDVDSGRDLPDTLRWIKFSRPAWKKDGTGFFYGRYDEPQPGAELSQVNYFQKLYFHSLGTEQSRDVLVYERPDQKEWGFQGRVSDDGAWLVLSVTQGTDPRNRVFYLPLEKGPPPPVSAGAVVELIGELEAAYDFIGNDGPVLWFRTDLGAPRGRLIAIDTREPARERWREVLAESEATLRGVDVVGGHFVASYLENAHSAVRVFDLSGRLVRDVDLPGLGTAAGFSGEADDPETFYAFTSFTNPGMIHRYDVASGRSEVFRAPELRFDPSRYVTEQVFYRSKDGTRVPMFLTRRKDLARDGSNPALLYGYGGFEVSLTPSFNPARIAWLEMGGIYAVANLRGGGEYGQAWHQAGTKLSKQNVFDDFIAAAEWLETSGWTSRGRVATQGGSNGGLLVAACMVQRPELFGAVVANVGVLDMLRFHRFTIGWAWTSDYGSAEAPSEFEALRAYSPYHNLREGSCYPPTLITTADHDDRVVPAHSFKFTAALQHAQGCSNPVLIRIDVRAGHGAGKPTTKLIDQYADEMAFLVRELGVSASAPAAEPRSGLEVAAPAARPEPRNR
jgi:prolyl oligopeptidase